MSQEEHNDVGEPQTNPSLYAVEVRAPTVAWTPVPAGAGSPVQGKEVKLGIHTTETVGLPLTPSLPTSPSTCEAGEDLAARHRDQGRLRPQVAPKIPNYECGPAIRWSTSGTPATPPPPPTSSTTRWPGRSPGSTATRASPSSSPRCGERRRPRRVERAHVPRGVHRVLRGPRSPARPRQRPLGPGEAGHTAG